MLLAVVAVVATAVLLATGGKGAGQASPPATSAAGWRGLVGSRPRVALGERVIVVLKTPSLAQRVAAAGGIVSTRRERAWTNAVLSSEKLLASRLALQGVTVHPDFSYARVLAGFSALVDASAVPIIERDSDVAGVYPVRVAYPATISTRVLSRADYGPLSGHRPRDRHVGRRRAGRHDRPARHGRRRRRSVFARTRAEGDRPRRRLGRCARSRQARRFDAGRAPRHPDGRACSSAPAARRLSPASRPAPPSCRSASRAGSPTRSGITRSMRAATRSSPVSSGPWIRTTTVTRTTRARIALVALAEPFAAFADGPEARAAAGALALDTLVVAPAGNDGLAAAGYGDVSAPGGTPAALTVGALDARTQDDRVRVVLRAGLTTLLDDTASLAGAVRPDAPARSERCGSARNDSRYATHCAAAHRFLHAFRRQHRGRTRGARSGRRVACSGGHARRCGRSVGRAALRQRGGASRRRARTRRVDSDSGCLDLDQRGSCRAPTHRARRARRRCVARDRKRAERRARTASRPSPRRASRSTGG